MSDLIDRQAAIDDVCKMMYECFGADDEELDAIEVTLRELPAAQPDNQTNLCDSCDCSYPDCPSKYDDVIFGNGIGNDNICACNKYKPSAQPHLITEIQNGIKVTDTDDVYSCGMRNGMRWCMSLIDGKEPLYENCPSAQPEIVRCKDCKWKNRHNCTRAVEVFIDDDKYCAWAERRTNG